MQSEGPGIRERMGERRGLLPAGRESHSECLSGSEVLAGPSEATGHEEHQLVLDVVEAGAARARPAGQQTWQLAGLSLGGVAGHSGGVGAVTYDVESLPSLPSLLSNTAGVTETFLVRRRRRRMI